MTAVLCSWSGRSARPRTQHGCHHDTKVKPEAATAVIELLMVGGKTPETCWAVNKRQDNKLKNCCIWLVIYLNCTMMHGLTNLKNLYRSLFSVQESKNIFREKFSNISQTTALSYVEKTLSGVRSFLLSLWDCYIKWGKLNSVQPCSFSMINHQFMGMSPLQHEY